MSRLKVIGLAILACAVAGFALAQNANVYGGGPTANDYRLKVIQPAEGAKVVAPTLQVIVNTEIPGDNDTRRDVNSMPRPDVQVFLDDVVAGRMRDESNVVTLVNVTPGPHTIVLLALNRANEVIDRKEIHIIAVAPEPKPAPVVQHRVPPPAPAPPPVSRRLRSPRLQWPRCRRPRRPIRCWSWRVWRCSEEVWRCGASSEDQGSGWSASRAAAARGRREANESEALARSEAIF